ncbi:hypothetical protein Tco_0558313, partial [Tanacetum coccineum]
GGDGGDVGRMRWCDERGGGSDCGGRLLLPEGVEARGGGDRIDPGRIYLFIIWDSPEKFFGGDDMVVAGFRWRGGKEEDECLFMCVCVVEMEMK